jgi:hypothetical protein
MYFITRSTIPLLYLSRSVVWSRQCIGACWTSLYFTLLQCCVLWEGPACRGSLCFFLCVGKHADCYIWLLQFHAKCCWLLQHMLTATAAAAVCCSMLTACWLLHVTLQLTAAACWLHADCYMWLLQFHADCCWLLQHANCCSCCSCLLQNADCMLSATACCCSFTLSAADCCSICWLL